MVCRPRQPRASPVWQVLHDRAAKLSGLSTEATSAIAAFLRCGDLHAGFTRFHCPDCDHEFLLAGPADDFVQVDATEAVLKLTR